MSDRKAKRPRKPTVDAMLRHLIALERKHGCVLFSLRGREQFSTAINFKTGKATEMVCVKLALPASSPYGTRVAKNYDAKAKKAKKAVTRV